MTIAAANGMAVGGETNNPLFDEMSPARVTERPNCDVSQSPSTP
jgi:hypothetical protein